MLRLCAAILAWLGLLVPALATGFVTTVTFTSGVCPSGSVARTVSVPGVGPAVYAPVVASMEPPELFVDRLHEIGPSPPVAENACVPSGRSFTVVDGLIVTFGTTVIVPVAVAPTLSVTCTDSVPVVPLAVKVPSVSMEPPVLDVRRDHE